MAVRVQIEIQLGNRTAHAVAVANAGYESQWPEILVPLSFAEEVLLVTRTGAKPIRYTAAGGRQVDLVPLGRAKVRIAATDRETPQVDVELLASDGESEVIMNDSLVELLQMCLTKVRQGVWRFSDDPPNTERQSQSPAYY